jgi:hypothetical protein
MSDPFESFRAPEEKPFSQASFDSPAYRQRLMRKLNCLIAVLEVACAKVRRSLEGPDADRERLARIQKNLRDTLEVCQRAKRALERREQLPEDLPRQIRDAAATEDERRAASFGGEHVLRARRGAMVEMTSNDEYERFASRGAISAVEVASCDLDELTRQLQG